MTPDWRIWLPALARVAVALILIFACPALGLLAAMVSSRLRETLAKDASMLLQGLYANTGWPLALVVIAAVGALVIIHPFPPDDLARDLVAHARGYDYRQMFWASPRVPAYDQYLGFDHLAALASVLPAAWRALPFQLLPLLGLLAVMFLALQRDLPEDLPDRRLWIAGFVLLTLLMPGMTTRIMQGRPEIWFPVWALSALVLENWIWFCIGLLLAPLYWLAPVYAAGALLLRSSHRHAGQALAPLARDAMRHGGDDDPWCARLLWGAGYAVVASLIWFWLSGGLWLSGLTSLVASSHDRIGAVSETETIWKVIACSSAALWAVLAWVHRDGFRATLGKDRGLLLVLAIFLLPNMVRYTSMVSPLLVLLLARATLRSINAAACGGGMAKERRSHLQDANATACGRGTAKELARAALRTGNGAALIPAAGMRLLLTWTCIFVLPVGFAGSAAPAAGFLTHVKPGDRVLTPFSPALYGSRHDHASGPEAGTGPGARRNRLCRPAPLPRPLGGRIGPHRRRAGMPEAGLHRRTTAGLAGASSTAPRPASSGALTRRATSWRSCPEPVRATRP